MTDVTEKDLEQKRAANAKLLEQIAAAEQTVAERAANAQRVIDAAQLDVENERLQRQLAVAKEAAKVANVAAASDGPLAAAKEQLLLAQEQAKAPIGVVDTNAAVEAAAAAATPEVVEKKDGGNN